MGAGPPDFAFLQRKIQNFQGVIESGLRRVDLAGLASAFIAITPDHVAQQVIDPAAKAAHAFKQKLHLDRILSI